jgi:hypothetical protein
MNPIIESIKKRQSIGLFEQKPIPKNISIYCLWRLVILVDSGM